MTTLAQGNQVLNLILQQQTPREQLQELLASGLLSDLLNANLDNVDRNHFRKILGLRQIFPDPKVEKNLRQQEKENPLDRYPWLGRKFHFTGIDLVVDDLITDVSSHSLRTGIQALEVHVMEATTSEELKKLAWAAMQQYKMMDCEVLDEFGDRIGWAGEGAGSKWDFNFEDAHFVVLSNFAGTELVVVYEIKKFYKAHKPNLGPYSATNPKYCLDCGTKLTTLEIERRRCIP